MQTSDGFDMNKKTASFLFDKESHIDGNEHCFFCGNSCDDTYKRSDYVKKTFTNYDIVVKPGSRYVCGCCVSSMIGIDTTTLVDGDVKTGRGGAPRMYSWMLTDGDNFAFSKRHLRYACDIILNPPEPPFSIILADGIQKQLIFRGVVNTDKDNFIVMLDDLPILVNPEKLKKYLKIATSISAIVGKKLLKDPDCFNAYRQIIEANESENKLNEWIKIHSSPMGKLATWLAPGRKGYNNENVIKRAIPTEISRDSRQNNIDKKRTRKNSKGSSNQILLDFA